MSNVASNSNTIKYYWLDHGEISAQDTFFLDALDKTLWQAGSQDQWDTCWHIDMPEHSVYENLTSQQTINHIPGNSALTIKSNLNDTLTRAQQRLSGSPQEKRFDFFPQTFDMPKDYYVFQACAMKNPDWMWIQKPKNLSRGRGIEVVKHPSSVPFDEEWIIQRYLSEPHLYDNHKYVLRCYVLVTSVEPLRFYWYQEGFAKLASATYSNDDLDNPYRHLTNPDINEDNTDTETPVTFFSFAEYRQWLKNQGCNDEKLFNELKELIGLTVIAAREDMRESSQALTEHNGYYELIGLDCMVDSALKPWILECNLSPSLDTYTSTDAGNEASSELNIKKQLISDLVNIIGLNSQEDIVNLPPHKKMTWELNNKGNFECIFPAANANTYLPCFPIPRYADVATLPHTITPDTSQLNLSTNEKNEYIFEDSLAIYSEKNSNLSSDFLLPNDTASWIWLKNSEGASPNDIAQSLAEIQIKPKNMSDTEFQQQQLQQTWNTLSEWAYAGAFTATIQVTNQNNSEKNQWHCIGTFSTSAMNVALRIACPIVAEYLAPQLHSEAHHTDIENHLAIDILRSDTGYVITQNAHIIESQCKLSEILPTLYLHIKRNTITNKQITSIKGCVIRINERNILVANQQLALMDAFAYKLCQACNGEIISGSPILDNTSGDITSSNLPLYLPIDEHKIKDEGTPFTTVSIYNTTCWLIPIECQKTTLHIDHIIFPEKFHVLEKHSVKDTSTAEALQKIWQHSITQNTAVAHQLPDWIKGVPSTTIKFLNSDEMTNTYQKYM